MVQEGRLPASVVNPSPSAQHPVQPTGDDLVLSANLTAPAADVFVRRREKQSGKPPCIVKNVRCGH
jgi:hypothetical protein